MGKHNPPERKQRHARDIVRCLTTLSAMDGVLLLEQGRLWLLGPVAAVPPDAAALARALLAETLPPRADFSRLLGARHAVSLGVSRLADWARALTELEGRRDLEALIAEGVRPLRRYRGSDLRGRIPAARRRLERLSTLVQALNAAVQCQQAGPDGEVSPEVMVQALPLRLYALGDWPVDPVDELQALDLPADGPLLRLATTTMDRGLAALAALLFGARQRHTPRREAVGSPVPPTLTAPFQAGMAGCPAPCLWALAATEESGDLSGLETLSPEESASLITVAERVALLHGIPAARAALASLRRPLEGIDRSRARLRRFTALVQAHEQGRRVRPRSPEEAEVIRGLSQLDAPGAGTARVLVEVFLTWVAEGGTVRRLVPRRSLLRIAEEALPCGLAAAGRAMGDAWQKAFREESQSVRLLSRHVRQERLALALMYRDAAQTVPADAEASTLERLREALAGLKPERVREVLPVLLSVGDLAHCGNWYDLGRLLRTDLPAPLIVRAVRHHVIATATEFAGNPQALSRYLDCLEALEGRNVPNLDVRAAWFAGLFRSGRPWAPTVVLTLLNEARRQGSPDQHPAELFALSQALAAPGPLAPASQVLVQALEEWGTPAVRQPPAELEALASPPSLERRVLEEYLHHRRLAGHGETFTDALLEPLRQAEQEDREAAFLRVRLAEKGRPPQEASHLAVRLARLTDPALAAARRQQALARARKRLERSLALLRRESLERVLDDACRGYLRSLLGRVVPPGPLPAGLREALQLLSAPEINHDLLAGFIDDILRRRPLGERPVNRDWLTRAEAAGIDTGAWLAGFRLTVEIGGTPITLATERDPLVVLKMGSYFDTCLSLGTGCNAASTLLNALDVNKQVIYGRLPDGTVIARKLIGATLKRELAGYRTYAARDADPVRQQLAAALRDFARRCRLHLSDTATPETLHPGFWHDDGNEAWGDEADLPLALEPPPPDLPLDPAAVCEWNLCAALASADMERLKAVILHGQTPWREAALYHLVLQDSRALRGLQSRLREIDNRVMDFLTARGAFPAIQPLLQSSEDHHWNDSIGIGCPYLPFDPQAIQEGLRALTAIARSAAGRGQCVSFNSLWFPGFAAVAPVGQLLDVARCVSDLTQWGAGTDAEHPWLECPLLLQIAWLRDHDTAPLVRALAEDRPLLHHLIVGLARREVIPRLAPGLRKLLGRAGEHAAEVALALGTQGDPQDGPRLLALLRRHPESLPIAVGVVRSGDTGAAEEARSLWRPPRNLDQVAADPDWLALARELGSRRLARTLAREIRRCAYTFAVQDPDGSAGTRLNPLIRLLAVLNLPAPEGDAEALLRSLSQAEPYQKEEWFFRDQLAAIPALAEEGRVEAMADQLAGGGPDALEALAWWRRRQAASRMTHDRFERELRRLAVAGSMEERAAALEAWLEQTPDERRSRLLAGWLALFGTELAQFPTELRERLARAAWARIRGYGYPEDVAAALTWLEGLPPDTQREAMRDWPGSFTSLSGLVEHNVPVWLLRLEADGPRRAVAEAVLETWATTAPETGLLQTLNQALVWLRPEVAEPLIERVLAVVDADRLPDRDLLAWITADQPKSYRLQRSVLRAIVPRLTPTRRHAFLGGLQSVQQTARSQWLLAQAADGRPEAEESGC